jgi:hypothetical protein
VDQPEIDAIAQQVRDDRNRALAPVTAPRPWSFTAFRKVGSADGLAPDELRQAVAMAVDGIGRALSPDDVFGEDAQEEGLYAPEVWDVVDATGALACRVWIYGVDNGTVFRGDTIEVVAGCSQGGLESRHDPALVAELVAAKGRIASIPAGSCVKHLG